MGAMQRKAYGNKLSHHLTLIILFFHLPFFTATQPTKCLEQAIFCALKSMDYPL